MLTFVGLGLYDERSVTVEGRESIRSADRVFGEFYTSTLTGTTVDELEAYHGIDIEVRDRAGVEQHPEDILDAAADGDVVFLTAGDSMIATTHVDLRLRAHERGIDTRIVHGTSAQSAASGLTGLQNYRFGKATTLPFPYASGRDETDTGRTVDPSEGREVPDSVIETIDDNRDRGLHTLVYLDIKADTDRYMTADRAAGMLADHYPDALGVVVARAGSPDPYVKADHLSALADGDFGDPLHLLVIPGSLHHIEADALRELGGAPDAMLNVD